MLLCVLLLILTDLIIAEYQVTSLTSLCRKFSSSWSGVYSLSVISLSSSEEAIIVRLDQAEITAPLSCDLHIRSSRPGLGFSLDFPKIEIPRRLGDYQCESYLILQSRGSHTDRLCGHQGSSLSTESAGPRYQYNGSAEVKLKVRLLGDVSSLSLVSLELVVTPLIMNCQADHSRHIFRCGNNTTAYQDDGEVRDHCVSGKFVCDGRVNCLGETSDEAAQFCSDFNSNSDKENFISLETSAWVASALILLLIVSVFTGKLVRFYTRKRKLFLRIGEEMREGRVVVTQLGQEDIETAQTHHNYITILH